MQTQSQSVIESVEMGMKLVRDKKKVAIMGGRETLYFDSKRFGELDNYDLINLTAQESKFILFFNAI